MFLHVFGPGGGRIFWNLEKNYPASWAAKSAFVKTMFFFEFLDLWKNHPASWVEKISIFESSNLEFLELKKNAQLAG